LQQGRLPRSVDRGQLPVVQARTVTLVLIVSDSDPAMRSAPKDLVRE